MQFVYHFEFASTQVYDDTVRNNPYCCPFFIMGDVRTGQELLNEAQHDATRPAFPESHAGTVRQMISALTVICSDFGSLNSNSRQLTPNSRCAHGVGSFLSRFHSLLNPTAHSPSPTSPHSAWIPSTPPPGR